MNNEDKNHITKKSFACHASLFFANTIRRLNVGVHLTRSFWVGWGRLDSEIHVWATLNLLCRHRSQLILTVLISRGASRLNAYSTDPRGASTPLHRSTIASSVLLDYPMTWSCVSIFIVKGCLWSNVKILLFIYQRSQICSTWACKGNRVPQYQWSFISAFWSLQTNDPKTKIWISRFSALQEQPIKSQALNKEISLNDFKTIFWFICSVKVFVS